MKLPPKPPTVSRQESKLREKRDERVRYRDTETAGGRKREKHRKKENPECIYVCVRVIERKSKKETGGEEREDERERWQVFLCGCACLDAFVYT